MQKPGRNDPCSCGSGKKFKHCCAGKPAAGRPAHPQPAALVDNAFRHLQMGMPDAAAGFCRQALAIQPREPDALHLLGLLAHQAGRHEEAAEWISQALAANPRFAAAHNNLGLVMQAMGRGDQALAHTLKALAIDPGMLEAHLTHGNLLKQAGDLQGAIDACGRALRLNPRFAQAHYNLGNALRAAGRMEEAESAYRQALALLPDFAGAWHELGALYLETHRIEQAIASFRAGLARQPDLALAHNSLGLALIEAARADEAIAGFRAAIRCDAGYRDAWQNLFMAMLYSGTLPEDEFAQARRDFSARFEAPLTGGIPPHVREKTPGKLRIGLVSPDLRNHPIASFVAPVLEHHDRTATEIFCYSPNAHEDAVTQRLKPLAAQWLTCPELSEEALAARIRADGIDVLFDLSGHTQGNRLLAFARKPAPVQVAWLGYVAETGLNAMDYRIADAITDPVAPGGADAGPEQPWRIEPLWCVYRPCIREPAWLESADMQVQPPPALKNGFVTFGCLNNAAKLTPQVVALWAGLLHEVPQARLTLVARDAANPPIALLEGFAACGIGRERLTFLPYTQGNHYLHYHAIDIALDPFPHGGGTTTCDAAWMGVPFVTLAGSVFRSRMAATIATAIGHPEWVAQTPEEYVQKVVSMAADPAGLQALRAGLRDVMAASPLMDEAGFTRRWEAACREMVRRHS